MATGSVNRLVPIEAGGTGQTGVPNAETDKNTIFDSINTSAGYSITSVSFIKWGKIAQVTIVFQTSNGLTGGGASGKIGQLASAYCPKIVTGCMLRVNDGYGYVTNTGNIWVNGTVPANTDTYVYAFYLLP